MPTEEANIVSERQQLRFDGIDQRRVIATWQICAADRTIEQDIPYMGELGHSIKIDDMAWRVTRTMQHFENV